MSVLDLRPAARPTVSDGENLHPDMQFIPGGMFRMGSDRHYPEEAPVHRATVDAFWMDRTPVTNRQFRAFVRATGHVTFAEIPPKARSEERRVGKEGRSRWSTYR